MLQKTPGPSGVGTECNDFKINCATGRCGGAGSMFDDVQGLGALYQLEFQLILSQHACPTPSFLLAPVWRRK